jgi:hypothetical protein
MTAPHGHTARIFELAAELREIADKIERETAASIVETRTHGIMCGEYRWNEPEVAVHDVAPPDDGFAAHDEPPSRPLP